MITLIIGKKGSGKTKKLIQMANDAIKVTKGNVVVMEKGAKLTYDVNHKARLIDFDEYRIRGFEAFYGFVCGVCACNYDVTDILIDSTLKIGGPSLDELADFVAKLDKLSTHTNTKIVLSVSADEEEIPESINAVSVKI